MGWTTDVLISAVECIDLPRHDMAVSSLKCNSGSDFKIETAELLAKKYYLYLLRCAEAMKFNYFIPVFMVLTFSSAFATDVNQTAGKREQLFGTWSCDVSIVESGIEVRVISEDTYVRNGRFNSFGTLTMLFSKDTPPC